METSEGTECLKQEDETRSNVTEKIFIMRRLKSSKVDEREAKKLNVRIVHSLGKDIKMEEMTIDFHSVHYLDDVKYQALMKGGRTLKDEYKYKMVFAGKEIPLTSTLDWEPGNTFMMLSRRYKTEMSKFDKYRCDNKIHSPGLRIEPFVSYKHDFNLCDEKNCECQKLWNPRRKILVEFDMNKVVRDPLKSGYSGLFSQCTFRIFEIKDGGSHRDHRDRELVHKETFFRYGKAKGGIQRFLLIPEKNGWKKKTLYLCSLGSGAYGERTSIRWLFRTWGFGSKKKFEDEFFQERIKYVHSEEIIEFSSLLEVKFGGDDGSFKLGKLFLL